MNTNMTINWKTTAATKSAAVHLNTSESDKQCGLIDFKSLENTFLDSVKNYELK